MFSALSAFNVTQNEKDNDDSSSSRSAQTEHVTQWTNALGERARDEEEEEEDTQRRRMRAKSKFHANQNVINSWLMPSQVSLGQLSVAIFIMKMIRVRRQRERAR